MVILDRALEEREREGRPVRVGLIGAGFMGSAVVHCLQSMPGVRLVAIAARTPSKAEAALRREGSDRPRHAADETDVDAAAADSVPVVTANAAAICRAQSVDAVIEATGAVDDGAQVVLEAIRNGKHVVLMNMALDATVGPILKTYADEAGVVFTQTDGDEPGVAMNLLRLVRSLGCRPVLAGNVKGFYDRYRTPETQREFAASVGQDPQMVASFADGTKLALESTVLANATGFGVGRRGMYGFRCQHVRELAELVDPDEVLAAPLVDYVLDAEPGSGVFVIGHDADADAAAYMRYFKMGDGPLYVFYTPFHLPHREVGLTVARAALFGDAAVTPAGAPMCEAVTVAKRDLRADEVLDGGGGFTSYALIENAEESLRERLLPIGLSEGRRLARPVAKDEPISFDDVEPGPERTVDALYDEQLRHFAGAVESTGAMPSAAVEP
jgi:predicted homoserine dehydrogenase-like protein